MGGRGSSSSFFAEQNRVHSEAKAVLAAAGMTRYDPIEHGTRSASIVHKYSSMVEQLEAGKPISNRFTGATLDKIRELNEEMFLRSAKSVYHGDDGDRSFFIAFREEKKRHKAIDDFIKSVRGS